MDEVAKPMRSQMVSCQKFGEVECANSCLSHRSFKQEIQRGILMLRRGGLNLN
jgi:hypothetical protein